MSLARNTIIALEEVEIFRKLLFIRKQIIHSTMALAYVTKHLHAETIVLCYSYAPEKHTNVSDTVHFTAGSKQQFCLPSHCINPEDLCKHNVDVSVFECIYQQYLDEYLIFVLWDLYMTQNFTNLESPSSPEVAPCNYWALFSVDKRLYKDTNRYPNMRRCWTDCCGSQSYYICRVL